MIMTISIQTWISEKSRVLQDALTTLDVAEVNLGGGLDPF